MKNKHLLAEENRKLRRLQLMVDLTIQLLSQSDNLSLSESLQYIQNAKKFALLLFPDKGETFDLIYKPRFVRVLKERGILKIPLN